VASEFETVWTTIPLKGVSLGDRSEMSLGNDIALLRSDVRLLAARDDLSLLLSKVQSEDVGRADWFLVLRVLQSTLRAVDIPRTAERLLDALMAFQIIKPIVTYGLLFHGTESRDGQILWHGMDDRRWPMIGGQWSQMRRFDALLLKNVQEMLPRVHRVMSGTDIGKINAIHLLQLALEHPHPLIACLLAVTGMDAVLKSGRRRDFKERLCKLLGASTLAFPDWNSPHFLPPNHTVKDLAIPLYTLRNKVAHGADLREAARDKESPVDLGELKPYVSLHPPNWSLEMEMVQYATLLGEAAIYLLGQVLQRVL